MNDAHIRAFQQKFIVPGGVISRIIMRIQGASMIKPHVRRVLLNLAGADIHPTAVVERGCSITHRLRMGPHSYLNFECFVEKFDWLILEEGARMAPQCFVIMRSHGVGANPDRRSDHTKDFVGPVIIGSGCWIGARSIIKAGVKIASGCVVGMGTTMVESTEPNGVYLNAAGSNGIVRGRRVKELPVGASVKVNEG